MKRLYLLFPLLLWLAAASVAAGTLSSFEFEDPAQKSEFRDLIEELRCLVCQNESLAGSNAELAQDLRKEVYDMLVAGQTKEQVVAFMVERYGDFVLYRPPLKPSTYPLWYGPFILLAVAAFFLLRALRRKKASAETELSEQEQARLANLLDTPDSGGQEAEK